MGCCLSSNKPHPSPRFHRNSSKSPPPVDEETVKEVLSETPNPNHFSQIEHEPTKIQPRKSLHKIQHRQHNNLQDHNVSEDLSEICSTMSETVSTTTFEEDYEILRRRVTDGSPAKLRNRQTVGKSPARGKQQSPGRVRSGPEMNNRGSGYGYGPTNRVRSGSASRSRSPANRTVAGGNGIGRSPSVRKTDSSPGRIRSSRIRKPDLSLGRERELEESTWPTPGGNQNDDESLENPLVSLECFIFL